MKANPIANEERLRVQREKKQKYRQRVKESIATATAANLVTEQNGDPAFSQAHVRSRSIQKVAKTLQKSPRKRKEVISALANKFKLRIKPTQLKEFSIEREFKSCNMVPMDPHSLAEKYTCDSSSRTCIFSENECCYFTSVTMEEFPNDCDNEEYYEWAKVDGKVKKVVKSVIKLLKTTQNTHYNRLKENLKTNEFIIHVDYTEN